MYNVRNHLAPPILKNLFVKIGNPYNLRHDSQFSGSMIKSEYNGTESTQKYGPWNLTVSKKLIIQGRSKQQLKNWKPVNCPQHSFKLYLQNRSFLQKKVLKIKKEAKQGTAMMDVLVNFLPETPVFYSFCTPSRNGIVASFIADQ